MSLRAFHLFFIAASVVLAAFFAAWAAGQYQTSHEWAYVVTGALALAAGVGLGIYGTKFQRKTRHLAGKTLVMLIVVAAPRAALACPVCFGQNDSPMAVATNMGIIVMLVIVGGVLGAFATFFVHLIRRAKLIAAKELSEGTAR